MRQFAACLLRTAPRLDDWEGENEVSFTLFQPRPKDKGFLSLYYSGRYLTSPEQIREFRQFRTEKLPDKIVRENDVHLTGLAVLPRRQVQSLAKDTGTLFEWDGAKKPPNRHDNPYQCLHCKFQIDDGRFAEIKHKAMKRKFISEEEKQYLQKCERVFRLLARIANRSQLNQPLETNGGSTPTFVP